MNFYCVALKESSHFWLLSFIRLQRNRMKTQSNDELFRQFHLVKNLCRDIEPSNLIVTVFLRKILTACSCLKQNLYENRMRHQLLKSC